MFRELLSLPGRLLRPSTKATAGVADVIDPLDTGLVGEVEEVVAPVTETVGEVAAVVGETVGGVVDDVLDVFGFGD